MLKPKCGICSKVFSNGKALGGHMRSHLATLQIPPKKIEPTCSSLSSSSQNHDEQVTESTQKSGFKLVDPEIYDFGIVQDQESETDDAEVVVTESTQKATRKRSKRGRKMVLALPAESNSKKKKKMAELEQVSCVSCDSPDEEVAMCLMMLSRDVRGDSVELKPSHTTRGRGKKYQCETCKKVFKSFQALGGHRTSHKKSKNLFQESHEDVGVKLHECPFCYKLFRSGQALGGHKRSHLLSSSITTTLSNSTKLGGGGTRLNPSIRFNPTQSNSTRSSDMLSGGGGGGGGSLVNSTKFVEHLDIDLNLPAPMEEEEEELLEVSAVSDAELTPTNLQLVSYN